MVDFSTAHGQRTQERLETEQVVWLVTTSKDGTPQPSPVWFLWHGGAVTIFSDPDAPKVRNIARTPRIALHFNDRDGGDVVVLTGTASVGGQETFSEAAREAYVAKYAEGIKSLNLSPEGMFQQYSAMITFTPEKLRGF